MTQKERRRGVEKQIREVMFDTLGGHFLNLCKGPNDSLIEFWSVNGHVILVQKYIGDNGWTCYLCSKFNNINKTVDEIKAFYNL